MGASKDLFNNLREEELTVNMTFKIKGKYLVSFENEIRNTIKVLDYRVVPNTELLYDKDKTFQRLVKAEKEAKQNKQQYINKHNKQ